MLRRIIPVTGALVLPLLFGCGADPNDVTPIFFSRVGGFVLEYADSTRTTTVPVVDAWLEVLLPDGVTREHCFGRTFTGPDTPCDIVNWAAQTTTFDAAGRYEITVEDPSYCALRLRAWENHSLQDGVEIKTGKTATAPRLAAFCTHEGMQEGPTLIIE